LNFSPTDKTRSLLRNSELLYKDTVNGIQVVCDLARIEALEMYALDQDDPFSLDFKVTSGDPDFKSYSEPFSGAGSELLYFDNRATTGSGNQSITATEFVSRQDLRPLEAAEFEGVLSRRERLTPPDFVIRIFAENDKGSLLKHWLENPPTSYSIKFNSRKRFWKYYLLGRVVGSTAARDELYIFDPDNKVEFETVGEERLSDQSLAYTFRSRQQIPLTEHYPYRFQLRQKGRSGESTVISSLPVATIGQFGRETMADKEVIVSEIYINS
jgi:hypothetical protein